MPFALRNLRQSPSIHALLLIAGAALMIIVGLLGMHTFSADPVGHDTHHSALASTAKDHSPSIAVTSEATIGAPCDDACTMGTGQSHSGMAVVCILALFTSLILLLRPKLLEHLGPLLQGLVTSVRLRLLSIPSRTPSLLFLSISRT